MAGKIYAEVKLVEKQALSDEFIRLVLEGNEVSGFPPDALGGYVKLLFDHAQKPLLSLEHLDTDGFKPVMRSYTTSMHDGNTLAIDVFCDKAGGVAANWASAAEPGDRIVIVGPGKSQPLPSAYDSFFIVGDETAVPAISVQLQARPDARGICVVQSKSGLISPDVLPEGMALVMVDGDSGGGEALVDAALAQFWPEGKVYVWAACEFEQMRALRRYFRQQKLVAREDMYISSYWKRGETDEGNKRAKKLDAEADL